MNLRDYQKYAVEWAKTSDGLIIAPAGSGKTWIAASIIKHYQHGRPGWRFGWLAPTRETCQQARTSLRVAGVPDEIVDIRCPHESVDFSKKDMLIVDEAKHSPAAGWRRIIESCDGERYGFDATPWSDDEDRNIVLKRLFNQRTYEIKRSDIGDSLADAYLQLSDATDLNLKQKIDDNIDRLFVTRRRYMRISDDELKRMCAWESLVDIGICQNDARNQYAIDYAIEHLYMVARRRRVLLALALYFTLLAGTWRPACAGSPPALRLAAFSADVTVPLGHGMMGGAWLSKSIADPLEAHGLVLVGGGKPVVFVAVDWCEIRNEAFRRWQQVLAEAARTEPERVMVCTVHQHDAPVADLVAEQLLRARNAAGTVCDLSFHEVAVQRVAQALRQALLNVHPVTHLGLGQAQVRQIASNRLAYSARRRSKCLNKISRDIMRLKYLLISLFLLIVICPDTSAQLTGTKTIPGDYATIQAAITALNAQGVGAGGVTFNVAAGHTESVTAPIILTATGTSSNTIVFQKSDAGNYPKVTRTDGGGNSTSTLGGQGDAVIIIQGSDYVTFDGIDVTVNNQGIEYGYYLRKASGTDGCKYVTIKNAVINMTKGTSQFVVGIYSSNNDAASLVSSATGITITSEGGRHENVSITGNTIQNVFAGILLRGFNHTTSPYNFYDQNFVVGVNGAGNSIQNFAGNSANASYGVYLIYHNNANVSFNTINNTAGGGSNFTSTGYGIFHSGQRVSS